MFKTEVKNGVYRLVQIIRYSNGKIIKRILNKKTLMPISIEEVN